MRLGYYGRGDGHLHERTQAFSLKSLKTLEFMVNDGL
jgi:hypothetical protein